MNRGILLAVFFLSGAAGLIHEVAWTRLLRHVMGVSTYAVATVLTVFMGGLALGAWLAGKAAERRQDSLRVFAFLEIGVGLLCLAAPWLLGALEPAYGAAYRALSDTPQLIHPVRFALCAAVLLPPALLMGATLPVLARAFASAPSLGRDVGRLYAFNTLGAALGAALAGFVLLSRLGLSGTILLGSGINFLVAAAGFWLHARGARTGVVLPRAGRPERKAAAAWKPLAPLTPLGRTAALVLYACAGFCALVYEVAWTRLLSGMIGSSVYAFVLMLTAFILGLGFGSLLAAGRADRMENPLRVLAYLQAGIAVSALAALPLFGHLPYWTFSLIHRLAGSFALLHAAEFLLLMAIMSVPTLLMGACFPFMARIQAGEAGAASRSAGTVYAVNTVGCILGSFSTGFLLLPALGVRGALLLAVVLNAAVAAGFGFLDRPGRLRWALSALPAALLAVGLALPQWDGRLMDLGPFFLARITPEGAAHSRAGYREQLRRDQVLLREDGVESTVSVRKNPDGELSLFLNGKPDASSRSDLPTQILLAQLPILLHPEPRSALVIGLASGITLGSAARHASLDVLDCAEISSAVVRASRLFAPYNYDALSDPRVKLVVADGRNHLALSGRHYDVIVSEPSNPWVAGVADLYTREFFAIAREALTANGVLCVWFEGYSLDERSFRSIIRTFVEAFPNATLWNSMEADYLLIGSRGEMRVDPGELAKRMVQPAVASDLARIRIGDAASLLAHYVMGPEGLKGLSGNAPLHTDDNALVEFAAPRVAVRNADERILSRTLLARRENRFAPPGPPEKEMEFPLAAARRRLDSGECGPALEILSAAHASDSENAQALEMLATLLATHPDSSRRDVDRALELARKLNRMRPRDPGALAALAAALGAGRQFGQAIGAAAEAGILARHAGREDLTPMLRAMRADFGAGRPFRYPCR